MRTNRRAVAPVIATLLMIAIAVVGGTIIFVFSQGFFSQAQISGTPTIESVKVLGYDARDVTNLNAHEGIAMTVAGSDSTSQGKTIGEYVIVYVKNDSVGQVLISEIRLGGTSYTYQNVNPVVAFTAGTGGAYGILTNSTHMISNPASVIQAGETVGIIIELDDNIPIGRDTQFKLTTHPGAVFVSTIVMGQNID